MALSDVQIGAIGQMEFVKLGTLGSKGALDYDSPDADDDRRDHEIHRRGRFGPTLAVQTKVSTVLRKRARRDSRFQVQFFEERKRLVSSPMFWYFFAHLDPRRMRFSDPCFLVPSRVVHRRCLGHRPGESVWVRFTASMKPGSRDQWTGYRVVNSDVGSHLLEILDRLSKARIAPEESGRVLQMAGVAIVRQRRSAGP